MKMKMGSIARQYLASASSTLSVAIVATCFTWMEPLLQYFISPESEIPMTSTDTSWIVSSIEFSEVGMVIPAGLLADRYGRKIVLLSTGPLCLVSWLLVLFTRSKALLYVIRCIQGIALAIVFTVTPMYIAEISEPRIRGQLSGQFQTMWYVGILYCYLTGHYLSYQNYIYVCSVGPIIFTTIFYWMPESPYYQLTVDRPKEAIESLRWLRAINQVDEEFESINKSVEKDMKCKGGWKDLFATKKDIKCFLIVQLVCFSKYMTGMTAMVSYATPTFSHLSNGAIKDYELTIILGVLLIATNFCATFVSDSVGRKPLIIFSTLGSAVCNFVTGLYFFLIQRGFDLSQYIWVLFVSVALFCIVTNIGLGPLTQAIQAEYFPSHTRGIGGGLTGITIAVVTFINLKLYQTLEDIAGVYLNFWVSAVFSFFGAIFMFCFLDETAGKSLGQIQTDLERSVVDTLKY